ncbi:Detected protein of unknown function [Hibiscus syriacus]|uniref:Uncharacterized protein n=1 Tax=Hibiscus syriacus TaxID=106335 RepID=A0A6A3CGJ6_HIBSY|nr:Detected protein of unknown function [Hibiscus syriacus]
MGVLKQTSVFKISLLITFLFISFTARLGAAIRPWHWQGEQLFRQVLPDFRSLQRGPVPPSGPSSCTNIPGRSGRCINGINVAGHLLHSPPVFEGTTSMGE